METFLLLVACKREAGLRHCGSAPPHSRSSGRWALAASILGSGMAFLDGSVITVSLPVLQSQLGTSVATAQWIVEAYALFLFLARARGRLASPTASGAGRSSSSASSCSRRPRSRAAWPRCADAHRGSRPPGHRRSASRPVQPRDARRRVFGERAGKGRGDLVRPDFPGQRDRPGARRMARSGHLVEGGLFHQPAHRGRAALDHASKGSRDSQSSRRPAGRGRSAAGDGRPWRARLRPHRGADPRMGRPASSGARRGGRGGTGGLRRRRTSRAASHGPVEPLPQPDVHRGQPSDCSSYAALAALLLPALRPHPGPRLHAGRVRSGPSSADRSRLRRIACRGRVRRPRGPAPAVDGRPAASPRVARPLRGRAADAGYVVSTSSPCSSSSASASPSPSLP